MKNSGGVKASKLSVSTISLMPLSQDALLISPNMAQNWLAEEKGQENDPELLAPSNHEISSR